MAVTIEQSQGRSSELPGDGRAGAAKPSDRRQEPRFPYQTVVTLVRVQNGESFELRKCWTRDLSPSGARIMSLEPIEGPKVLLKFLLPKLGSKYIESEICSRSEEQQTDIRNRATTMYLYGVKFTNVLSDAEACDRIL
jgi:hypothetical protein